MPNPRRLNISHKRDSALVATRVTIGKDRMVYVLVADKRLKYPGGKSRIAYVGTTRKGLSRVARSVAVRADRILGLAGVRSFSARIVTCRPRQRVRTWRKLERALLLTFREVFGAPPRCNVHGKRMKWADEREYFRSKRLVDLIEELS